MYLCTQNRKDTKNMKKIIYLLALVLAVSISTCADAQVKKLLQANSFTLEYDASKWEVEPVDAGVQGVIDVFALFHTPLSEMISIAVYESNAPAHLFLQKQIEDRTGLLEGALIGGEIDNATCWGQTVYFVNFGRELSGTVYVGTAVVGNVNGHVVYAAGITSDPEEREYLDVISAIQFKKQ